MPNYRGFLAELLMAECDDRARRRSERRIKAAGFPREKSLRTFEAGRQPGRSQNGGIVVPEAIGSAAVCGVRGCRTAKASRMRPRSVR